MQRLRVLLLFLVTVVLSRTLLAVGYTHTFQLSDLEVKTLLSLAKLEINIMNF